MTHPWTLRQAAAMLAGCLTTAGSAFADPLQLEPLQLEAAISRDDNLTRASEAPDRLGDSMLTLGISRSAWVQVAPTMRAVFTGTLAADKFSHYERLDRLSGSLGAQLQHRGSAAFDAPIFSVFANVQQDGYRNAQRSGTRTAFGASVRQSWTDRIDAFAAVTWSDRNAHDSTFDQREHGIRAHLDYAVGRYGTLYASAEYRRGDVVSTSRGYELEYAHASRAHGMDDAFGPGWWAYRYRGRTTVWTAGWSLPLKSDRALDLSWRQALSRVHIPGDPATGDPGETLRYRDNLVSVSYLLRF